MRLAMIFLALPALVCAQSFTGTVSGSVHDASGAVVPGSNLALINANTNERRAQQSNADGSYLFALVPPGSYRLEAETAGFKRFIRTNLTIEVNQSVVIDVALEVGTAAESVQVTAETPLLQPTTSSLGQVVDNRKIVEFPLAGRNTFALISLTAGAQPLGEFGNIPARANAYAAGYFSMNGSQPLSNETLIDGVPANAATTNAPGLTPSVDAIQEFKVQSGNFTAEFGRTGGGVVNLVFKSGTNQLHGTAYEFLRNSAFDANNFFNNRAGRRKARNVLNQFGASAGGPLIKDRTFWFVNYEGLRDRRALSQTYTIPTTEQLQGDFTQTLNAQGQPITIADPATTRANPAQAGSFLRDLFPANRVPANRLDRVAERVRTFWPAPNAPGSGPARVNNWNGAGVAPNIQDQFSVRMDHSLSDSHKIFGRFSWSNINRGGFDFFGNGAGWVNPGGSGMPIDVNARNLSLDDTYSFSPTLLMNLRYGFVRQWVARDPPLAGLDLSTLGFPAEFNSQVGAKALPSFMPTGFRAVHQRGTDNIRRGDLTHSVQGNITKVTSRHNLKTGADYRAIFLNEFEPIISQGQFFFDGRFTSADPLRITANSGHSVASFLLGLPNSGNIDIQPPVSVGYRYFGGYIQDDFKVNQKLTLNLGLRYEVETGRSERYQRLSYFDTAAANPLGPRVGIPDLRGGLRFVDENARRQKQTNWNNWGPRFGFAWQINSRTVVRGGYGLFFLPNTGDGAGPANANEGFTAVTQFVSSIDGGITPADRLSNPFPRGVLRGPGASQGLLTQLGQNLTTVRFAERSAYSQAWNFNIQRELPGNFLFDAAYTANKGTSLPVNLEFNQLPDDFLALGSQLLAQVANPFREFVSVGTLSQPTVARGQLLRPFPQFGNVLHRDVRTGSSIYHSLQLKVEHRFSRGFSFLSAFTAAKQIGTPLSHTVVSDPGFQNNNRRFLDRSLSGFDVARRLVVSGNWELPIGKGKSLLSGAHGISQVIAGGWQLNGILTLQTGFPLGVVTAANQTNSFGGGSRPNNNGRSAKLSGSTRERLERWFDTTVFSQPAAFTFGNTARTLPDVRTPGLYNVDFSVTKVTPITERIGTQFRAEFFNGFNHPNFGSPGNALGNANFGVISSAQDPRIIQLGMKVIFWVLVFVALLLAAASPEEKAIGHLARQVPSWHAENKCYSCHNNGDGARALFAALRKGHSVDAAALEGTTQWLSAPSKWESNHGDAQFSDKKLARLQFAAALAEAPGNGKALTEASAMLVRDQLADGSWAGDAGSPAGSPVTYNAALATYMARRVLMRTDAGRFADPIRRATEWLNKRAIATTPDAAAIALSTNRADAIAYLRDSQNKDGGWGPAPKMPSEVFDTALALLALKGDAKGRAYLIRMQLDAGGWPETTRPSGGQSYAQHVSATAWALLALLETGGN